VVALAAACDGAAAHRDRAPLPVSAPVVYSAGLPPWPPPPWTGRIGRGSAGLRPVPAEIRSPVARSPLVPDGLWAVPGPGPARAVVAGPGGAVDLVDVDAGAVVWRATCPGPVVHVAAGAVVCGGDPLVGLGLADGAERWRHAGRFRAATDDLIVAAEADAIAVLDAGSGAEAARFAPPAGVAADDLVAACRVDGGVDAWAWASGRLTRVAVGGATARAAWSVPVAERPRLDACDDAVLVATPSGDAEWLTAYARASGALVGGPVRALGVWPARGEGGLELATEIGLERRRRDLSGPERLGDVRLGRRIAARGDRRLVADRAGGLALLDARGAAALAGPRGVDRAVLGDRYLIAVAAPGGPLRRWALPAGAAPVPPAAVAPDESAAAFHPDLPAPSPPSAPIALDRAGHHRVASVVVDPIDPALVYAVALEAASGPDRGAGIAQLDLRSRAWRWYADDVCPPGEPLGLAVAADVIACASAGGGVRGVGRLDGAPRWRWTAAGAPVDRVLAAGDLAAVVRGDEVAILDAASGAELDRFADDAGGAARVALIADGPSAFVVAAERGGAVARWPRVGMLPRWALRVDGSIAALGEVGGQVAIALTTGELYRVARRGDTALAAADIALDWRLSGGDVAVALQQGGELRIAAFGTDGVARFRIALGGEPAPRLAGARGRDPRAPLVVGDAAARQAILLDPVSGLPLRRVALPEGADPDLLFATAVDGRPVAGAILAQPLAIALF